MSYASLFSCIDTGLVFEDELAAALQSELALDKRKGVSRSTAEIARAVISKQTKECHENGVMALCRNVSPALMALGEALDTQPDGDFQLHIPALNTAKTDKV